MRLGLDRRYGVLTVAYVAVIYSLSSMPALSGPETDPLVLLLFNLGHAPLFAGLAFCALKTLSAAPLSPARYALAFVASAACAALDEWHQSLVPGRHASIGDFLLDLAGIAAMLLLLRLRAIHTDRDVSSTLICVRHS